MATPEQIRAVQALADVIEGTARDMGAEGAPSGIVYAALMGHVTFDQFTSLLGALERAGRVKVRGHVIYAGAAS